MGVSTGIITLKLNTRAAAAYALLLTLAVAPGCPIAPRTADIGANSGSGASTTSSATSATASSVTVVSGGPKAIRIIFKQNYPSGSFDASPANGTPATPGSGHQAARYFNADGSLLAGAANSWLSSFEVGVSGSNNLSAKNPNCAKFADTAESSATDNCNFSSGAVGCGAPSGLYRVSEYDCLATAGQVAADGTGGPSDGIYLRATLNRSLLGSGENVLAVLEYVASAFSQTPSTPTSCFTNGVPTPEKCSNVAWKVYAKHAATEVVQPFLMLAPPTENYVVSGTGTSGASPKMRQFVIPLAGDPRLSVIQISRIHSNLDVTSSKSTCNAQNATAANSPLCAGIVLYSLTLYRI